MYTPRKESHKVIVKGLDVGTRAGRRRPGIVKGEIINPFSCDGAYDCEQM